MGKGTKKRMQHGATTRCVGRRRRLELLPYYTTATYLSNNVFPSFVFGIWSSISHCTVYYQEWRPLMSVDVGITRESAEVDCTFGGRRRHQSMPCAMVLVLVRRCPTGFGKVLVDAKERKEKNGARSGPPKRKRARGRSRDFFYINHEPWRYHFSRQGYWSPSTSISDTILCTVLDRH